MIINLSRKNSNQLENCQKFAHKLFWNSWTWHALDDLTFHGQSTSLRGQSQNGLRHVTDDKRGWFLTFITQTISDNIVMWETRHCTLDWVYFKTQTLLVILRTQNQPLVESCVFLEVEHLFQTVGCARNKLLSRSGCWIAHGLVTCSWYLGHSDGSTTFNQQQCPTQTYKPPGNWDDSPFQN